MRIVYTGATALPRSYGEVVQQRTLPPQLAGAASLAAASSLGPLYVNDLVGLGTPPAIFSGHLRCLTDDEIPDMGRFNGVHAVANFCHWWVWGSSTGPCGPCPPPRSVIAWKGNRSGLTGARSKKRNGISLFCNLFDLVNLRASRKHSGSLLQKLQTAWNDLDTQRGTLSLSRFVNKVLIKTTDWQAVKQGEKLKKGQSKTPKLVVRDDDDEADDEPDEPASESGRVQSSGRSMSTPLAGGSRRALSILQQAQSSTG